MAFHTRVLSAQPINVNIMTFLFFYLDNKAPTISIRSPPALNSSTPTIEWSTNEYVTFQCSLDNQFFDCGEGNSSSWTGNNLDDGLHRFTIQGKDEVGNIGKHTHTWSQGKIKLRALLLTLFLLIRIFYL